jgi:hypothetical protein
LDCQSKRKTVFLLFSCGDLATVSSACCNFDELCGLDSALEMGCRSNEDCRAGQEASGSGIASGLDKSVPGYTMYASGWMYGNQQGQMCGPYTQQQLYDGLSTNFLPEDLLVYPIINGYTANSVPLKYFKQFPDHVATGFAYLQNGIISVAPSVTSFPPSSSNATVHQDEIQTEHATSATHLISHQTMPPQTSSNGSVLDQLTLNHEESNMLASFLSLVTSFQRETNMLAGFSLMVKVEIMVHILYWSFLVGSSMDMFQMQP